MGAAGLHSQEAGLEEGLGAPEPLVADGGDLAVGQLVGLLQEGGASCGEHLLLEIPGDIALLHLDVVDDLPLGGGGEEVAPSGEDLHEVVGELAAGKVESDHGVGEGIPFVDAAGVGGTVTSGTAGGVQREHSPDGHVHGGHVEGDDHDLGSLSPWQLLASISVRVNELASRESTASLGSCSMELVTRAGRIYRV